MQKYKHSTPGRESEIENGQVTLIRHKDGDTIRIVALGLNEQDLVELGHVKIEEQQEDRIDRAFDYFSNGEKDFTKPMIELVPIVFREAIEKHMPKPKKVEENDIRDFVMGQSMSREQAEAITKFLKAFGLLAK